MFYIRRIGRSGSVVAEFEEIDYEGLDALQVFHVGSNNERRRLSNETVEEMIDTWLDPDFMFTLGYPLPH